jgi:flagellar hook protein FlgE
MSPISSTALSGLNAASLQLQSSAHNIANTQTPGFRRQLVQQTAQPEGGVSASVAQAAQPGEALAEDIVNQMAASVLYRANAQTLRTDRDLSGTLIDLLA